MKKIILLIALSAYLFAGWGGKDQEKTANGISAKHAKSQLVVRTNSNGNTLEQQNIIDSYKVENTPGAIKHLYVISNFTGKIIRYSTVKGKVTDNAKGLQPSETTGAGVSYMKFDLNGVTERTNQVMQESGTYGTSSPYIYWFDTKGVYNKLWMNTSATVTVSNQPLPISASGEIVMKFQ